MDSNRLDAYHFYEKEWDSYEQLLDEFEWEIPDTFNMAEYVCDRWADEKYRVAFFAETADGEERTFTYWQLKRITNQLANYFVDNGIARGDRIGINTPQKPEGLFAHIAAWKVGAVSVPLSTLFGPDALEYRINDSGAKACLIDESNFDTFRGVKDELDSLEFALTVGDVEREADEADLWEAISGCSTEFETKTADPDDDAVIAYTSGTTGSPKGVLLAHRTLLGYLPGQIPALFDMEMNDSDVIWTPIELAWGPTIFGIILSPMFYGKPIVLYQGGSFDADAAFDIIEKYGVTNYYVTPTAIRMMMQVDNPREQYDVSQLRVMYTGGEAVDESIRNWTAGTFDGAVLNEAYGQTECNPLIAESNALGVSRPGKMGKPCPGREMAIVDPETAEPIDEPGEPGEIAVRTENMPSLFKEYWNKPEKTAQKIQDGWLLTEDSGTVDEDGYYAFGGRTDYVILCSGYRVGPQEIEDTISRHSAVADAGVIGVDHEVRGEVPKAFITLADGYEPSDDLREELKQFVKDELAKYEYPRELEFVDDLPKTSTEKIQRHELEKLEASGR